MSGPKSNLKEASSAANGAAGLNVLTRLASWNDPQTTLVQLGAMKLPDLADLKSGLILEHADGSGRAIILGYTPLGKLSLCSMNGNSISVFDRDLISIRIEIARGKLATVGGQSPTPLLAMRRRDTPGEKLIEAEIKWTELPSGTVIKDIVTGWREEILTVKPCPHKAASADVASLVHTGRSVFLIEQTRTNGELSEMLNRPMVTVQAPDALTKALNVRLTDSDMAPAPHSRAPKISKLTTDVVKDLLNTLVTRSLEIARDETCHVISRSRSDWDDVSVAYARHEKIVAAVGAIHRGALTGVASGQLPPELEQHLTEAARIMEGEPTLRTVTAAWKGCLGSLKRIGQAAHSLEEAAAKLLHDSSPARSGGIFEFEKNISFAGARELHDLTQSYHELPTAPSVRHYGIVTINPSPEMWHSYHEKHARLVSYKENGATLGFALYLPPEGYLRLPETLRDAIQPEWMEKGSIGYLAMAWVSPLAPEGTLGRLLGHAEVDLLSGSGVKWLLQTTNDHNHRGVAAYFKHGFHLTGGVYHGRSDLAPTPERLNITDGDTELATLTRFYGMWRPVASEARATFPPMNPSDIPPMMSALKSYHLLEPQIDSELVRLKVAALEVHELAKVHENIKDWFRFLDSIEAFDKGRSELLPELEATLESLIHPAMRPDVEEALRSAERGESSLREALWALLPARGILGAEEEWVATRLKELASSLTPPYKADAIEKFFLASSRAERNPARILLEPDLASY